MLRIRLRRMGPRSRPTYRAVVIDSRKARDGRYLEALGHYDPRTKSLELNLDRTRYWLDRGAQASDTVAALIRRVERAATAAPTATAPVAPTATSPEPATTDVAASDTATTEGDRREGTD
uniref:Small ribosomal subunit protein bS16 n=1 Tax=candidate division WOR-3 bacterium TaxID=2052148 RepID=A0A7C4CBZ1_UNCW3